MHSPPRQFLDRLLTTAVAALVSSAVLGQPRTAVALPAPGPLRFIAPTPGASSVSTTTSVDVRLDATCTFDTGTLAVSFDGNAIPASSFLPFSACTNGRITSQTVSVGHTLPSSTILSAPATLTAGDTGVFSGIGDGDELRWNFDGGAAPDTGSSVNATFNPAGAFTVRLIATEGRSLAASGMDSGNLVTAERDFAAGDATPATRQLTVTMPPDVDFVNYESGHVHPLALSTGGDRLFAVNTPEGRLAIFDIDGDDGSLSFAGDVPVGLDPVSCAVRPGTDEVWVVNHLSDSVSVVDTGVGAVIATIAVGDEPTDVVFASGRAFVTLAGNEDRVKVYDAAARNQLASIDIFGDDPRALAASADGTEVYAVVLESGNQTTVLFHELVSNGGGPPPPSPPRAGGLGPAPDVGLIVQFNPATGDWEDDAGGDWSSFVDFALPDQDVFVIDANAGTPSVVDTVSTVGTTLFDVVVHPGTGDVWVTNTDARNLVRFEPNLRGHLVETRVSIVDPGSGTVSPVDINPHINFAVTPGPPGEIALSLSQPGNGVFSSTGSTFYVTAFGSGKVGVLNGTTGAVTDRIDVGGGPSGVALNESDNRLYVMNRFDNTISTVNTATNTEIAVTGVAGPSQFDPSPDVIKAGRLFLYEGQLTSGHGDAACATCHTFSNFDNLAWDLGDPQGQFVDYDDAPWVSFFALGASTQGFDPMKGPMTTQTLRGLKQMEPFHWRGDRQDFQAFNPAFVNLMGTDQELSGADMDAYTDFIMTVNLPPNPFRNLDDSLPSAITVPNQNGGGPVNGNPNVGDSAFSNQQLDGPFTCADCHALPTGTNNDLFNGQAEGESQDFKIPHLRNMYEKMGFLVIRPGVTNGDGSSIGPSALKAGFGFLHDGSLSLSEFLAAGVFDMGTQLERDMFAFMLAFPTESAPAIGHQVTFDAGNKNDGGLAAEVGMLIGQAEAGNCDVIAKGVLGGIAKGYVYDTGTNAFLPDSLLEDPIAESALRGSISAGDVLTYTGVPPGAGVRLGIDRDRDTWLDRSEKTLLSDPADPNSNPWEF